MCQTPTRLGRSNGRARSDRLATRPLLEFQRIDRSAETGRTSNRKTEDAQNDNAAGLHAAGPSGMSGLRSILELAGDLSDRLEGVPVAQIGHDQRRHEHNRQNEKGGNLRDSR